MESYRRWLTTMDTDLPALAALGRALPYMVVSQRKAVLTMARCQLPPVISSRLYQRNAREYRSNVCYKDELGANCTDTLHSLCLGVGPHLSPIVAGLLSVMTRMAPYQDYSSVEEELRSGIAKELKAAVEKYHPTTSTYESIFHPSRSVRNSTRLFPNLPIRSTVHEDTFRALSKSKSQLQKARFYPQCSTKTIGKRARRNGNITFPRLQTATCQVESTVDLEKIYHATGFKICGETEVRTAWRYNDLKPRVYYARGPDQYYVSRPIQLVFNIILENLPNVSKFGRHNPITMPHSLDDVVFIYDYSAFTSTLHEIRRFTSKLADFFSDTFISIVDSHLGIQSVNLGELLHEYNQLCNIEADFDASDLLDMEEFILRHNCGMLGIPGNISSCTLLHGIHLAVIIGSLHRNKVVGDDAIGRFVVGELEEEELCSALGNLGVVARTKMEFWRPGDLMTDTDQAWHYVKRPMTVIEGRICVGRLVTWPDISNIFHFTDAYHTIRDLDLRRRVEKYCSQLLRFITECEESDPSDMDIAIIEKCVRHFHRAMGFTANGRFVSEELPGLEMHCPTSHWTGKVVEHMMERLSGIVVRLPRHYDPNAISGTLEVRKGTPFAYKGDGMLSLGRKLGYVSSELVKDEFLGGEFPERIQRWLSRDVDPVYEYTLSWDTPKWMYDDIRLRLTGVPEEVDDTSLVSDVSDMDSDEELMW